jgi:uncharacterized protein (DUF2147 family)
MKTWILVALLGLAVGSGKAQSSITGKWQSIDDNSGKPRSIIEIFERKGQVFGRVIKIYYKPGEDPDPVCTECSSDDPRFNKKVIGMEILQNMVKDGDVFNGGHILDPDVGKVYRCKIWLEGEELKVRGYLGPFYRTQTWFRFNP